MNAEQFVARMKKEHTRFWNEERTAKLKRCKLSKYEVITLASIVYEEVKIPSEMRMIAGVYINRLRRGIALGACPTIKYAMGDFELKRILHKHLTYRSPFNTYINRGLPPAPIANVGRAAIMAVLRPANTKYLYFVADGQADNFQRFLCKAAQQHLHNGKQQHMGLQILP